MTDFLYGVILFKDEEENEIRKEIEEEHIFHFVHSWPLDLF